jgi:murein DD-endopeptidase MepM/ murein hydrolase activator NlpD
VIRHVSLKRLLLLAALALSGAVVAFATLAPSPQAEASLLRRAVVEPLAVQPAAGVLPEPIAYRIEERYARGDTLSGLLARMGVAPDDARRLVRVPSMRYLRAGYAVTAELGPEGDVHWLSFLSARDRRMRIERADEGFRAEEQPVVLQTGGRGALRRHPELAVRRHRRGRYPGRRRHAARGHLRRRRRFPSRAAQGRPLFRHLRAAVAGRTPGVRGRVLGAEFVNQGRVLRAVHYEREKGGSGYYAPDGSNLRKAFLRSPLEYTRISSRFGLRRHPFQRAWRAHTGVDYAAPTGTRVRAAGDGIVEFAGWKGGYGKVVILRHRGRYSTLYAHLSRFEPGLRRGQRVAQGEVVGRVGSTGWATGPHLHYEFHVGGRARNPYAIAMPAGEPVPEAELAAFRRQADPLIARLERLAAYQLAQSE